MKSTLIVAGLGRCGTTAVMRELDAAGFPVIGNAPNYDPGIDPLGPVPSGAFKWTSLEWGKMHPAWFHDTEPGQQVSMLWMYRRNSAEWRKSFVRRRADSDLISLSSRMAEEWDRLVAECRLSGTGVARQLEWLSLSNKLDHPLCGIVSLWGFWRNRGPVRFMSLAFEDLLANPAILESYFLGRGYQWGQEIRKRSSRVPKVPLELELLQAGPPKRYPR